MQRNTSCAFALTCALAAFGMPAHAAEDIDARIAALSDGPDKEAIVLGRNIVLDTPRHAPGHVRGGALSCTNCHLDGGTRPHASPWYGITGVNPAYNARSASVESLAQRINHCFERSENGTALPLESREMNGLLAYMTFVSRGIAVGEFGPGRGMGAIEGAGRGAADTVHGKVIYEQKCAACHGANGEGMQSGGKYSVPPLWGDASYNIAASMARLGRAAAFIKHNMPLGNATLTDQEALDVAAYVTRQPRPDFQAKANDWPKGGKPADARY
ncbi:MAG TPA: c-type cytochrome [Trinickia sp.]|nr:c-type cytochrome [Trinickia sp.]